MARRNKVYIRDGKQTLLQQAKEIKPSVYKKTYPDKELQELAMAWVREEISVTQIGKVLNLHSSGGAIYCKLALALKAYLRTIK